MMNEIREYTLDNGITIIAEKMKEGRSCTIGFWIKTGSIVEEPEIGGVNHFIEHMLFKGTAKRSALDIARAFDIIGGQLNAYTSKDCVCYFAKVLDENFNVAIDVITDMLTESKFDESDINLERSVILDEISMYYDNPDELGFDILLEKIYPEQSIGAPILGTADSVKALNKEKLEQYFDEYYNPQNLFITIAGNYDESHIEHLNQTIGQYQFDSVKLADKNMPKYEGGYVLKYKDIEQIYVNMAFEGLSFNHPHSYALLVLNNIVAGTVSSRLFQKVREENGLTYAIDSQPSYYDQCGIYTIYYSLSKENMEKCNELILKELKAFINGEISEIEVEEAKSHLKGSYILGLETSDDYMNYLGKSQLHYNKIKTLDEVIEEIENVDHETILKLAKDILRADKFALSVVGDIEEKEVEKMYKYFTA